MSHSDPKHLGESIRGILNPDFANAKSGSMHENRNTVRLERIGNMYVRNGDL